MARKQKKEAPPLARPVITPAARRFMGELAKRQDRAWLSTRKEQLQQLLNGPVEAVLREVGARVLDVFPAVEDAAPKMFRIYRDVRFSKDKQPFKDHVAGTLSLGRFAFYFHVSATETFAGVGPWSMEPDELKRYRAAVADTLLGPALLAETRKLQKLGFELMSAGELARAPAGVAPDHPCIQLLRHKGWAVVFPAPPKQSLANATLPSVLATQLKKTRQALSLLERAVGAAAPPARRDQR